MSGSSARPEKITEACLPIISLCEDIRGSWLYFNSDFGTALEDIVKNIESHAELAMGVFTTLKKLIEVEMHKVAMEKNVGKRTSRGSSSKGVCVQS